MYIERLILWKGSIEYVCRTAKEMGRRVEFGGRVWLSCVTVLKGANVGRGLNRKIFYAVPIFFSLSFSILILINSLN